MPSDYPEFERFAGMLSLPYLTPGGVVAVKFRALDPERKPKYDAPSGQTSRLYNVAALHSAGDVVAICEGEIDALVMTELVGIPAVGVPGATQWAGHKHWPRAFADYETVLVIADNDEAGLKSAATIAKGVSGGRVITPPAGLDLNAWYLEEGREAIRGACNV